MPQADACAYWSLKGEDGITHTGIVVGKDENGRLLIVQATKNGGGESINDKYKTNVNGDLWAGSVYESNFVGAGRPVDEDKVYGTIYLDNVTVDGANESGGTQSTGLQQMSNGVQASADQALKEREAQRTREEAERANKEFGLAITPSDY